ncbi:MAG: sortase [Bellilinea sp.]
MKLSFAVKKLTPYLLVFMGVIVIILGVTGSLPVIRDRILLRLGLRNELEVSTMGFKPFAVPVASRSEHEVAPNVEITQAAAVSYSNLFPTPTLASLSPYTDTTEVAPTPTPEPTPFPTIPARLEIPSIELDAPIIAANPSEIRIGSDYYEQWEAPDEFAVGWHTTSSRLGEIGNTVLNGHHNIFDRVFENLHKVEPGQEIIVYGGNLRYTYIVVNVMILPERNVDMATRGENARWILPSTDERLTLITCWPAESNTHRLIVVAQPLNKPVEITPTMAPAGLK